MSVERDIEGNYYGILDEAIGATRISPRIAREVVQQDEMPQLPMTFSTGRHSHQLPSTHHYDEDSPYTIP